MKLFVWSNPYFVPYGSSMVFAIAKTLDDAKKEATSGNGFIYGEFPDDPPSEMKLGEPTRIVDLPCAEWHKWSE